MTGGAPPAHVERLLSSDAPGCEDVLRALPAWFGLEQPILDYRAAATTHPTFGTRDAQGVVQSFLTVIRHYPRSAEVHCMGVRPALRGQGVGTALLRAAEVWLQKEGVEFLQVKTLSERSPDRGYAETRAFYLARGFVPLEELRDLWDAHNPCLVLIKSLC
ncbi:MAG: GNAT family N-acetyltransferase [Planctomycetes bacterium]|nr:GNAT family N-acetyltransferase [Planctomycetota bacterium]